MKMEAAKSAKEKTDKEGDRGEDQTDLEQRAGANGGTRESDKHEQE